MNSTSIPLRMLHMVWADLWPLLEPAVLRSPDAAAKRLLARLVAGDDMLWAVYEDNKPVSAVVTTIQIAEGGDKRCLLWLVGGTRVKEWAPTFMDALEKWARGLGCVAIWGTGRKGWHRIVPLFGGEKISDHRGEPAWERRIA